MPGQKRQRGEPRCSHWRENSALRPPASQRASGEQSPAETGEIRVPIRRRLGSVLKNADDRRDSDHVYQGGSCESRPAATASPSEPCARDQHAKLDPRDLEAQRVQGREIEGEEGFLQVEEQAMDGYEEPKEQRHVLEGPRVAEGQQGEEGDEGGGGAQGEEGKLLEPGAGGAPAGGAAEAAERVDVEDEEGDGQGDDDGFGEETGGEARERQAVPAGVEARSRGGGGGGDGLDVGEQGEDVEEAGEHVAALGGPGDRLDAQGMDGEDEGGEGGAPAEGDGGGGGRQG